MFDCCVKKNVVFVGGGNGIVCGNIASSDEVSLVPVGQSILII